MLKILWIMNNRKFPNISSLLNWPHRGQTHHNSSVIVYWTDLKRLTLHLEKAMATHSVLLPGKSHGWKSLVGCSHWAAKSRAWLSNFTFTFHFHALEKAITTHSSVLAWRVPGMGKPGGLPSMGSHRVGHDWSDLAAAATTLYLTFFL